MGQTPTKENPYPYPFSQPYPQPASRPRPCFIIMVNQSDTALTIWMSYGTGNPPIRAGTLNPGESVFSDWVYPGDLWRGLAVAEDEEHVHRECGVMPWKGKRMVNCCRWHGCVECGPGTYGARRVIYVI